MRLSMVTETYPPEVNGVARTLGIYVEGLRALGHTIELVRPRQSAADLAHDEPGFSEVLRPGFAIPRYPQLRMGLPSRRALMRAWSGNRPDLVHIATEGPLGWSALGAANALGIPVATDFHTNFHAYTGHYGVGILARAVTAYLRRFHNSAGCTIVPTDELASELKALGFQRLHVAGRGINAAVFSPARRSARLRESWGADPETPVVLSVSRFAPEKNFELVLEAYRAMRDARPDARLVLVGDGPMEARLRRADLGCVVAGRLVNGELSAHYASADIFLFPSLTETFGNVTVEAMASGLGVVAYDYAAARQYIAHGRSGLLAARGDENGFIRQAVRLAKNLEEARALGRAAREVAEDLSWERAVAELESALHITVADRSAFGTGINSPPCTATPLSAPTIATARKNSMTQ